MLCCYLMRMKNKRLTRGVMGTIYMNLRLLFGLSCFILLANIEENSNYKNLAAKTYMT